MGDKRSRKQLKRARREEEKRRYEAREQPERLVCPNCYERCRSDRPTRFHRCGPCGADPKTVADLKQKIKERIESFGDDPATTLPCLSCGRQIKYDEETFFTCEGHLVWYGCDHCKEANDDKVEATLQSLRETWPEIVAVRLTEAEAIADKAKVDQEKAEERRRALILARARFEAQASQAYAAIMASAKLPVGTEPQVGAQDAGNGGPESNAPGVLQPGLPPN